MLENGYEWDFAYAQSKFALVAYTLELAQRLRAEGDTEVTANTLHPATLMPTKLVLGSYGRTVDSLEQGVAATLRLVIDPRLDAISGAFFNGRSEWTADPMAYDAGTRRRLWELSDRLTGLS